MSRDRPALSLGPAILFCPGDRPDRFGKALAAADAVILDLEDAVSPARKGEAREAVCDALRHLPVDRVAVRINSPRDEAGQRDLAMLAGTQLRFLLVPKVESAAEAALAPFSVIALCETACGVQQADDIARVPGCCALMWGGEDLTADIGGRQSRGRDGAYLSHVQYARARILVAAAAAAVAAWDGVWLDIPDLAGLERECHDAAAMGFAAKVAIHPTHAPVIRQAYRPSPERVDWARRLLGAMGEAESGVMQSGVISFEGRMVDGPLVAMARTIVAAASHP